MSIRKVKKTICFLIAFILISMSVRMDTEAAGGLSISASASQVTSGGTFTVTVRAASNYFVSNLSLKVSGGTVVSGLGASSLDKGESTSAKIKLTGQTCTVSVSGVGANYSTETEGAASASVTVREKTVVVDNRSKDNSLSALTVSTGTLSPAFSAGTTEYSVTLDGSVDKITLDAKANDAKATVSGTGEKALVPGNNQFAIICTAENGAQKQYTVNVQVDETPVVYTGYQKQELGVVRNQNDIGIPATFEAATVRLEGQEVPAYHSNQFDMTLVYLVDESGNKNFYMYDELEGITSVFRPITILGRNVVVFDLTEEEQERENMVYTEVTIDGQTLYGWTYENPKYENYIHIMVMNEFGEKVIYQYEKTENSLQLFQQYEEEVSEVDVKEPETKAQKLLDLLEQYHLYIIAGLGVVILILVIVVICLAVRDRDGYIDEYGYYVEPAPREKPSKKKEPKESKPEKQKPEKRKTEKKKRKHDARRRKAIKRLEKQRANEDW